MGRINRPRLNTTISQETMNILEMTARETGLQKLAPTVDFVVTDWARTKRAAIQSAAPAQPIPQEPPA